MATGFDSAAANLRAGDGGASALSGSVTESLNGDGKNGAAYGGGGSGAANSASQVTARTGGTGAAGAVIIVTFF